MRIAGQLPKFISNNFTPRITGVSLTNLQGSCTNGIVTFTFDELPDPHKDTTRSGYPNKYALQSIIMSGFSSGTNYPTYPSSSWANNFWDTHNKNISNFTPGDLNIFSSAATIANPYESSSVDVSGITTGSNSYGKQAAVSYYPGSVSTAYGSESNRTATIDITSINQNRIDQGIPRWKFGGVIPAGPARIWVRPFIVSTLSAFSPTYTPFLYYGNWSHFDVNLSGPNIPTKNEITTAQNLSISGRKVSWTNDTDLASYYIYVYKWNGSSWAELRQGFLNDSNPNLLPGTGDQSYTIPESDGSGFFIVQVYTGSSYVYATYSSAATIPSPGYFTL